MPNEHEDIEPGEEPAVDRSRLKMLGILAAAGATGGCSTSKEPGKGYRTFGSQPYPKDDDEPMGGEGGGGDGGSH
jgi:hypothetical protein